jgi:hypothetical protein
MPNTTDAHKSYGGKVLYVIATKGSDDLTVKRSVHGQNRKELAVDIPSEEQSFHSYVWAAFPLKDRPEEGVLGGKESRPGQSCSESDPRTGEHENFQSDSPAFGLSPFLQRDAAQTGQTQRRALDGLSDSERRVFLSAKLPSRWTGVILQRSQDSRTREFPIE